MFLIISLSKWNLSSHLDFLEILSIKTVCNKKGMLSCCLESLTRVKYPPLGKDLHVRRSKVFDPKFETKATIV